MKKKKIELNKKLILNKETISNLNKELKALVAGGQVGKTIDVCAPFSGTGCGCGNRTCGIVVCSAVGVCDAEDAIL